MSYHEAYWVAVATAAPVIALAFTVSLSDAVNTRLDADVRKIGVTSKAIYAAIIFGSAGNFILQIVALYLALKSLYQEHNQNINLVAHFIVGGLANVLLLVIYTTIIKYGIAKARTKESSHRRNKPPGRRVT